jgi:isopenicillin N synthase-like dioxygenase
MELEVISYADLLDSDNAAISDKIKSALYMTGIVGVRDVPTFREKSDAYIKAAREFSALDMNIKTKYTPDRDAGLTEGYELGAEQFQDQNGKWQTDDKKVSYYAFVPDHPRNKWPTEVDFKTPYLTLGDLMFKTGKQVLKLLGMNETIGLHHDEMVGYGRMLHYLKEGNTEDQNPNWCGAHFDHGVFTALMPSYYFTDGLEVEEPGDSGLYIMPSNGTKFEKINATDKNIMIFQVGEFVQLASNDQIRATKHLVKKAKGNIERFTFALFFSADDDAVIHSNSELTMDARYIDNKFFNGSISYGKWEAASYERYRAL